MHPPPSSFPPPPCPSRLRLCCAIVDPARAIGADPLCSSQHYPEPNTGWMNEEGVRIDMQHRLVPKAPLRSALKRPRQVTI